MIQINPQIKEKLNSIGVDEGIGLAYLLATYHGFAVPVSSETIAQINQLRIVERDYQVQNRVIWHVPLYMDEPVTETAWEWVEDWRKLFGALRRDAIGSKQACYKKMKSFFASNPEIRKDEIIRATEEYLQLFKMGKSDVKYLQQADYFISKATVDGQGRTFNSRLELYLEVVRTNNQVSVDPNAQRYFKQVI